MRDDLCSGKRAQSRALDQRAAARQTVKKPRSIEIAGARRIDELFDLFRFHHVKLILEGDDASCFRSRQHGELDLFPHTLQSLVEAAGFIERGELPFIGEENVDIARNQLSEAASVPLD